MTEHLFVSTIYAVEVLVDVTFVLVLLAAIADRSTRGKRNTRLLLWALVAMFVGHALESALWSFARLPSSDLWALADSWIWISSAAASAAARLAVLVVVIWIVLRD